MWIYDTFPFCSIDGKYLVSLGSGGPCKVWDVISSKAIATLARENVRILTLLFLLSPLWVVTCSHTCSLVFWTWSYKTVDLDVPVSPGTKCIYMFLLALTNDIILPCPRFPFDIVLVHLTFWRISFSLGNVWCRMRSLGFVGFLKVVKMNRSFTQPLCKVKCFMC